MRSENSPRMGQGVGPGRTFLWLEWNVLLLIQTAETKAKTAINTKRKLHNYHKIFLRICSPNSIIIPRPEFPAMFALKLKMFAGL